MPMSEPGEFGESVVENRAREIEEKRENHVKQAIEKGYECFADGEVARAGAFALLAGHKMTKLGRVNEPVTTLQRTVELYIDRETEEYLRGTTKEQVRECCRLWGWSDVEVVRTALIEEFETDSEIERLDHKIRRALVDDPQSPGEEVYSALATVEAEAVEDGIVPAKVNATYVLGEDFEESPLHEMFEKRERQGRSLQAIIVARDNDTGTGKTTLAVSLCKKWGDGWTAENATNRPAEYRDFLNNKPEGSVLLADEIGQMYDSRRSMSSANVEVSQDWQMIRTKRYKTISTLPGPSFLDKRLKKLADVMIVATRRGHARAYRLKVDDASGDIWRDHLCNVEWGALDDDDDYQAVEQMKRDRLSQRFEGGDDQDDGADEIGPDEARREGRNETIRQLVEDGLTQTQVADALDMDQSAISRIVREDSD